MKQFIGSTTGFRDGTCPLGSSETGRQDRNVKSCVTEITQVLLCTARGAALPKGGISCQHWCEVWFALPGLALAFLQLLLFESTVFLLSAFCPP